MLNFICNKNMAIFGDEQPIPIIFVPLCCHKTGVYGVWEGFVRRVMSINAKNKSEYTRLRLPISQYLYGKGILR